MQQSPYQNIEILYEDEWILCLDKPANLSTTQTLDPNRPSLEGFVKNQLGYSKIHLPHRLDVGTSGVVLISKQAEFHKAVSQIFELRYAQKIYWAVCSNLPSFWGSTQAVDQPKIDKSPQKSIITWDKLQLQTLTQTHQQHYQQASQNLINPFFHPDLTSDQQLAHLAHISPQFKTPMIYQQIDHLGLISKKPDRYGQVKSGGLKAITTFEYLQKAKINQNPVHLIEARPKTGRTHQIRVHLSDKNAPIIGDQLYSHQKPNPDQNLLLKAKFLIFPHPLKDQWLCVG